MRRTSIFSRPGRLVLAVVFLLGNALTTPMEVSGTSAEPIPLFQSYDCSSVSEIPLTECEALRAWYQSTNGDGWYNHTNWFLNNTPSTWYGVTVTSGHVTDLVFIGNNLSGVLPHEIGNLTGLKNLSLNGNSIGGEIPPEITSLSALQYLEIDFNALSGSIPAAIGNLTNLVVIDLQYNGLTGKIPAGIGNLTNLTDLNLSENGFSGAIPTSIGNLTSLQRLYLNSNQFSGGLPAEIGSLTALTYLYVNQNQFSGQIPAQLGSLVNLQRLSLSNNHFSGEIPGTITNLNQLKSWGTDLGLNHLTSIDQNVRNFLAAKDADWESTQTTAPYCGFINTPGFNECSTLDAFYTSTNGSSWTIRTNWMSNLTPCTWYGVTCTEGAVTSVDLHANNLTGAIPSGIGSLQNLTYLDLSQNLISGNIPTSIGGLQNLQTLRIDHNQLTGALPVELFSIPGLNRLNLSFNNFTGNLPAEIGNLSNLQYLDIQNNSFTGSIPSTIVGLSLLEFKYQNTGLCEHTSSAFITWLEGIPTLSRTNLPCEFSCAAIETISPEECTALTMLFNSTNGPLWTNRTNWLQTLTPGDWFGVVVQDGYVKQINLSGNHLTGTLPDTYDFYFTYLSSIDLSNNQIQGSIPYRWMYMSQLQTLRLNANQLTGFIPNNINNLYFLKELDVCNNSLSGPLPASIGQVTTLETLKVCHNDLLGEIPGSIVNLVNLNENAGITDLGSNHLSATDPAVVSFLNNKDPDWSSTQSAVTGAMYYVSTTGNDSNTCTTAESACATIQAAIDKSSNYDVVQIGAGTYTENIILHKSIKLQGSGKTATILNGGGTGRVLDIPASFDIQIHDMTIQNGTGIASGDDYGDGGGIRSMGGILSLQNVLVQGNHAEASGGGIFVSYEASGLSIVNSEFLDNTAVGSGGGVGSFLTNSNVVISGTLFTGNSAQSGGGLMTTGATSISNTVFQNNTASSYNGGAIENGWGWGGWGEPSPAILTIDDSKFLANHAQGSGGAIHLAEGTFSITDTIFDGNSANTGSGGAISVGISGYDATPSIHASCIIKNSPYSIDVTTDGDDLNATGNWWGQASGPSLNGPGTGDSISTHVNFSGFLTASILGCGSSATPKAPPAPIPLLPSGTVSDYNPIYSWAHVPSANSYILNVKNSAGTTIFTETYPSAQVCTDAVTCQVEPRVKLLNGSYKWALKSHNVAGDSAWSIYRGFVINAPPPITRYVSPTGNDGQDCLSPATACTTIQSTIGRSLQGDLIHVLPGTYQQNITIDRDITIFGSNKEETIIDGSASGSVFTVGKFDVKLSNLTIRNGSANSGGGVFNEGKLIIENVILTSNQASQDGGGLFNSYEADLLAVNSHIFLNEAQHDGGGAMLQGHAVFSSTEIDENTAGSNGGGIFTHGGDILLKSGSSLNNNLNGGIMNWWSGKITLEDSTVDSNSGYGVYSGGPYALATITRSTVSRNTEVGIRNSDSGTVVISNSTISGNGSNGIETNGGNHVDASNSTIAFNTGNGIYAYDPVNLKSTIISNNTAGNCNTPVFSTYIVSQGNNLEWGHSCQLNKTGDKSDGNPLLSPLQNNGGPTETHALDIRSAAVDSAGSIGCPAVDQRSFKRPIKASTITACDIGSYELAPSAPSMATLISPTHNATIDLVKPTLTWNDMTGTSGATQYSLQVNLPDGTLKTTVIKAADYCENGTCSILYPIPLKNGAHQWKVRTENPLGVANWSNTWTFNIAATLPGTATALSPDSEQVYDPTPTFSWSGAENAVEYELEVRNGGGTVVISSRQPAETICPTGDACSVTLNTLIPTSGNYSWKVRAWNSTGPGDWSVTAVFSDYISKPAVPIPDSPNGTITNGRPAYSWQAVQHALQYQIQIKNSAGAIILTQTVEDTTTGTRPDFRLSNGKYSWQVRAWNPIGWGTWSNVKSFTLAAPARVEWYVAPAGNDLNSCVSPLSACKTIQAAIDKASADDIVHIAAGTYQENLQIDKDLRLQGNMNKPVIDGNQADSVISTCANWGFIEISNLILKNGSASVGGGIEFGCFDFLRVESSKIIDNRAVSGGGGIYSAGGVTLLMTDSTVSGNYVSNGSGAGINLSTGGGQAKIINSTLFGNRADSSGWSSGGAILSSKPMQIINSTITNNDAYFGGGICISSDTQIISSTITDNGAGWGGGIDSFDPWMFCYGTVSLKNTIIAGNGAAEPSTANCWGPTVTSNGYNIEDQNTCKLKGAGDLIYTDPLVGPLQDNGGPTETQALLQGSPALDSGDNAGCPSTDQRGTPRPQDADGNKTSMCDRGAYERPDLISDQVVLKSPLTNFITNSTALTLTWFSVLDTESEEKYQVQVARDANFKNIVLSNDTTDSWFDTPALSDGKYYWRVRASRGQVIWGKWSVYRLFTIDTTAPAAPVLSTPLAGSQIRGTPKFGWKSSATANAYQFQYDQSMDFSSPDYTTTLQGISFIPPTMSVGDYYWHVRARDAAGNWSPWSLPWSIAILPPVPATPILGSPANNATINDSTPELTWYPVQYADHYQVDVATDSAFLQLKIHADVLSPTYTPVNPFSDGKYYWRVRSVNINNEYGAWSAYRILNLDTSAPASPILTSPLSGTIQRITPTFTWQSSATATRYQLSYDDANDFSTPVYVSNELSTTSHQPPTMPLGLFYWRVRARDMAGNWSNWSNMSTVNIYPPYLPAPTPLSPSANSVLTDNTPTFTWTSVSEAQAYQFAIATDYGFWLTIDQRDLTELTYTRLESLPDGKYYWRVRTYNQYNEPGNWSIPRIFTINAIP